MIKKRWIAIFSVLLVIVIIVLVLRNWKHSEKLTTSRESQSVLPVMLKIGYMPIAECAHLYVGIAKKYFEQEGIDIELYQMKGGAVILPVLQKGDLDIGFSNVVSQIILDSKLTKNDPYYLISLIGASYERPGNSNHALLVRKDSGLSISDLGNSKIRFAINTTHNIEELMLRRFLSIKNVYSKKLNLVCIGFPEMLSALDRGGVDVVSVVEPFIEPALRDGRFSLLARQYLEVSPETLVATYTVTKQWLDNNNDNAKRFIRAFKKADEFIKNNEPETREIIGSFTRIRKEDLPIIGIASFDFTVKEMALKELVDEMQKYEFIHSFPNPKDMIYELNGK